MISRLWLWCGICMLTACAAGKKTVTYTPFFPSDWLGEWEGTLEIFSASGRTMELPMRCIHTARTDGHFDWQLIYGSGDKKDVRPYVLRLVNARAGHYQVDELNGILLDGFVLNDRYVSTFEVMGNVIQTQYIRHELGMDFEVYMHPAKAFHLSGDTIIGTDTIPSVTSFRNAVYQRAKLKRKP